MADNKYNWICKNKKEWKTHNICQLQWSIRTPLRTFSHCHLN